MNLSTSNWRPNPDKAILQARAQLLKNIRSYFNAQGVMEVETPSLSATTITDPHLEPIEVGKWFLQTSPEYAMKRLLASGSGDIYQIGKAFRADEAGKLHNPEFSLLEWYRLGFRPEHMYEELERLMQLTLDVDGIDIFSYRELFDTILGIDIELVTDHELKQLLMKYCSGLMLEDRDDMLTSLFSICIEPELGQNRPVIVADYPASQASLARLNPDKPGYAERFELFFQGIELANGFHELTDPHEQNQRFEKDNALRHQDNKPIRQIDQRLIDALSHGLPDCTGVALGIDRLLMLKLGCQSIREVMAFDISNA